MRVVLVVVLVVTWENKVNSYSDQLKLGLVCKFGVEFDNSCHSKSVLMMQSTVSLIFHAVLQIPSLLIIDNI